MGKPDVTIVCKYCGHRKHWHTGQPESACVVVEGDEDSGGGAFLEESGDGLYWMCDCLEWVYGVNADDLPIPPVEDLDADEMEDERKDHRQ